MAIDTAPPPPPPPPALPPPMKARRGSAPAAASPQAIRLRRRWGRFAIGATLALLGAWVSAALFLSAGNRVEVVVLANDVDQYQKIEKDDLTTARVAADPGVETISAGQRDELIGRYAAVGLRKGNLLSANQLVSKDAKLLGPDEASFGAELGAGDAPWSQMKGGAEVWLVLQSAGVGEDAAPRRIPGWILDIGDADEDNGKRTVEIVVAQDSLAEAADASKDDRLIMSTRGS